MADAVQAQADKVRDLKAAKAPKGEIKAAVDQLLALKKEAGVDTNSGSQAKSARPQQAKKEKVQVVREHPPVDQNDPIAVQSDKVRQMKAAGAPKDEIKAAVDVLLALKAASGVTVHQKEKPAKKQAAPKESKPAAAKPAADKPAAAKPVSAPRSVPSRVTSNVITKDFAWFPDVPPGHTAFSWDEDVMAGDDAAPIVTVHVSTGGASAPRKPNVAQSSGLSTAGLVATLAASNAADALALMSAEVQTWLSLEQKSDWLTSKLSTVVDGCLRWKKEEKRAVSELPRGQLELFAQEVEHCLQTKAAHISQGAHDRYMEYCVNIRENGHGQVGAGHTLYLHALSCLHGLAGTKMDKVSAVLHLHQAAGDGVAEALSLLGYCYELGDGLKPDLERAAVCYLTSHAMGDPHGTVRLGRSLWEGLKGALEQDRARVPALLDSGLAELRARVARSQDGSTGVSRALSVLHTQFNLV